MTGLRNIMWLAKRQLKDNWLSFPLSIFYFMVMGLVIGRDLEPAVSYAHAIIMLFILSPALSQRYMSLRKDNEIVRYQQFMRAMPVPVRTHILATFTVSIVSGLVNVVAYFSMVWLANPEWPSFGRFLLWATFWIGIAIAATGMLLIQEFLLDIRQWVALTFVISIILAVIVILLRVSTDLWPRLHTFPLQVGDPWLMAMIGLGIGGVGLSLGMRLALARYPRRELLT